MVCSYYPFIALLLSEGATPADCFKLPKGHRKTFALFETGGGRRELSLKIGKQVHEIDWGLFNKQLDAIRAHDHCDTFSTSRSRLRLWGEVDAHDTVDRSGPKRGPAVGGQTARRARSGHCAAKDEWSKNPCKPSLPEPIGPSPSTRALPDHDNSQVSSISKNVTPGSEIFSRTTRR